METATAAPRRLGDLLLDKGYLSEEGLQTALAMQRKDSRNKLLGSAGHLSEVRAALSGEPAGVS